MNGFSFETVSKVSGDCHIELVEIYIAGKQICSILRQAQYDIQAQYDTQAHTSTGSHFDRLSMTINSISRLSKNW